MRPGPPPRIEVDLTEFLTEQNKFKPEEETVKTQTDEFVARPLTPEYVPKKTGRDVITEIGDYDLFEYDRTPPLDKTPTRPACLCLGYSLGCIGLLCIRAQRPGK